LSFFTTMGFTFFLFILFAGIFLNLFGLPGTVVIFFDVLFYAIFTGFNHIGLKIILLLLILSVIAETIDVFFVAGGTSRSVASKNLWARRH